MQAPKTYSPQEMASAQGASSREAAQTSAIVNNTNQVTPFGNVTYSNAGYETIKDANGNDVQIPRYTQTTTLSDAQQGMLDKTNTLGSKGLDLANNQIDRLGTTLNKPFDTSGLPAATAPTLDTSKMAMSAAQPDVQTGAAPTTFAQRQVNTGGNGVENYGGNLQQGGAQTGVGPSDFSQDRLNVENAILSRVEPQFQRDEELARSRLANQGLTPGSEASNADLDTLNRARNDARMGAVLAGGQEQSRMFGQQLQQGQFANQAVGQNNAAAQAVQAFGLQRNQQNNAARLASAADQRAAIGQNNAANLAGGQFAQQGTTLNNAAALAQGQFRNASVGQNNAANLASQQAQNQALSDQYGINMTGRQNALQEALTVRNQPINEISALMSGGQVQVPSFQQPYQQNVQTTDIAGMMQQDNQQKTQNYYNQMSGLFGLGSSLAGGLFSLSDKRAKKNITRVGKTDEGLPIYRYQYKKGVGGNGMFQLGVMAQEVEKSRPDAVMTGPDGLKRVDYGKVA
jgi:hypothetical protein